MNSTRYMTGVSANDTLPSSNQGMGMINLGMAFGTVVRILKDQPRRTTATGQYSRGRGERERPPRSPFRHPGLDGRPGRHLGQRLQQQPDLTVTVGGNTYKGNVFSGADSVTGGAADPRNNVESVFVPAGLRGTSSW